MAVNGVCGAVHQHAQFKLGVRVLWMFRLQNAIDEVRNHLVADKSARVAAFRCIVQIGPEMIDQVLLCQTQIGLRVVNQMPNALACAWVQMRPLRPYLFALGVGGSGTRIEMRHVAHSMKELPIGEKERSKNSHGPRRMGVL